MFYIREIAGWALMVLGLWLFYLSYFVLLKNGYIIQSGPTVLMGIVVAARVCQQSPVEAQPKPTRPVAGRLQRRAPVVPGRR
jgi:hypothetical protein